MWKSWKNKAACAALAAVTLALAGCGDYAFDESAVSGSYSLPAQTGAEAPQTREFSLMANADVTVDRATGRANVLLGNPEQNTRNCRVTLVLDETGETLYQTDVLEPGEREAWAELDTEPFGGEAGNYAATALFEILDEETGETIGTVEAGVTLTVE